MTDSSYSRYVANPHRDDLLVREIYDQARIAYEELVRDEEDIVAELPAKLAARLGPFGYLSLAGATAVFADFKVGIDVVVWKTSQFVAAAIVIDDGMAADRLESLDSFNPDLLIPDAGLVKISLSLRAPIGTKQPTQSGESYVCGFTKTAMRPTAAPNRTITDDSPF